MRIPRDKRRKIEEVIILIIFSIIIENSK